MPQLANRIGAGAIEIDQLRREGGEHHHLAPGAGDGNVEPPPAAGAIERPEIHRHDRRIRRLGPVSDAEQDEIALVALHGLEILDDDRLGRILFEKGLERGILAPGAIEQILDQLLLLGVERDHRQRQPRPLLVDEAGIQQTTDHLGDDRLRLDLVGAALATRPCTPNLAQAHHRVARHRRGKGDQIGIVIMPIGESDQAFVTAAIMPGQAPLRQARAEAFLQDALLIALDVAVILLGAGTAIEEAGGRHLLGIAGDDNLRATRDRADRIPWRDLRGFVEDHQIEQRRIGRQILRNRQRAHQQARRQRCQGGAHFRDKLANRLVAFLQLELMGQRAEADGLLLAVLGRDAACDPRPDIEAGQIAEQRIELAEAGDRIGLLGDVEIADDRLGIDRRFRPPPRISEIERLDGLARW